MNVVAVADTHTALWYLYGDPRLSSLARAFMRRATDEGNKIAVSSISLVEVVYLIEKSRIATSSYEDIRSVLADPEQMFMETPVSVSIVDFVRHISRAEVPDMPDRIIAGTALALGTPVISRDRHIRASSLTTIW